MGINVCGLGYATVTGELLDELLLGQRRAVSDLDCYYKPSPFSDFCLIKAGTADWRKTDRTPLFSEANNPQSRIAFLAKKVLSSQHLPARGYFDPKALSTKKPCAFHVLAVPWKFSASAFAARSMKACSEATKIMVTP